MSLGRGLDSLIPPKIVSPTAPSREKPGKTVGGEEILQLHPADISVNPHQPRREFNHAALEDLINSIREHGILQPLIVTEIAGGYELIAGERRLRAAQTLELETVPAIVREASDTEKLELAIIENVQRQDLNPIEEAAGYRRLIDEFSLTQEDVAKKVGKSRAVVANALRLLDLPSEVQEAIINNKISGSHAKILAGLETSEEQEQFLKKILSQKMTVRELERATQAKKGKTPTRVAGKSAEDLAREEILRQKLGTKVEIERAGKQGKIIIEFYSDEELQELIEGI